MSEHAIWESEEHVRFGVDFADFLRDSPTVDEVAMRELLHTSDGLGDGRAIAFEDYFEDD